MSERHIGDESILNKLTADAKYIVDGDCANALMSESTIIDTIAMTASVRSEICKIFLRKTSPTKQPKSEMTSDIESNIVDSLKVH